MSVPPRLVPKGLDRNVAVELTRMSMLCYRKLVTGHQTFRRLHPIHADQQLRAGPEQCVELAQQVG